MLSDRIFRKLLKQEELPAAEPSEIAEFIAERAAIMQYDGGLAPERAEEEAKRRANALFDQGLRE